MELSEVDNVHLDKGKLSTADMQVSEAMPPCCRSKSSLASSLRAVSTFDVDGQTAGRRRVTCSGQYYLEAVRYLQHRRSQLGAANKIRKSGPTIRAVRESVLCFIGARPKD